MMIIQSDILFLSCTYTFYLNILQKHCHFSHMEALSYFEFKLKSILDEGQIYLNLQEVYMENRSCLGEKEVMFCEK